MLTNLIENRGKEFSNLIKMGDYLSRSLRENVELFYVDGGVVTYLTESGKIINANYAFKPHLKLVNIQIDDATVLEEQDKFESVTDKKVSVLLSNLIESDYEEADKSFDNILSLFEAKLSYNRIKNRLHEKAKRFGDNNKIVSSLEFMNVLEVKQSLVKLLKENKEIAKIPEIKNGVKLATVISKSFNLPKVTLEQLDESKSYTVNLNDSASIYEHLCRQELVAKELLEAKQNFETTWANNEVISELASLVFDKDNDVIAEKLAETVTKIPYFALATKKQISTLIENSISLNEINITAKDLTFFVAKLYEMKKPIKDHLIGLLNDKYEINISNLTEIPTFSNLLKTESLIISCLAKLSPKNSVLQKTLDTFAKSLKEKNGAESIDLADFLYDIFTQAGYEESVNETSLMQYLDFNQVADDLGKIGTVLKLIRPMIQGGTTGAATPGVNPMDMANPASTGLEQTPEDPDDGMPADQLGDSPGVPAGDATTAAAQAQGSLPGMDQGGMPGQSPVPLEGSNDMTSLISSIEDLLSSIKGEIGADIPMGGNPNMEVEDDFNPEGGEVDPMAMAGGDVPLEGEEEVPPEQSGDFDGGGEAEGSNEGKPEPKNKDSKPAPKKKDNKKKDKKPSKE